MAKKVGYILIIFLFSVNIYAQSSLSVSATNKDLSKANVQMELTLNLNDNVDSLLYIVLPARLKAVPLLVQKNNNSLWLKNSKKEPQKKDAVSWNSADNNTLVFRFQKSALNSGDIIKIKCMARYRGKPAQDDKIVVKKDINSGNIAEVLLSSIGK